MVSNAELKKNAREQLGGSIFQNNWLMMLARLPHRYGVDERGVRRLFRGQPDRGRAFGLRPRAGNDRPRPQQGEDRAGRHV